MLKTGYAFPPTIRPSIIAAAGVALLVATIVHLGAPPIMAPWDVLVLLDGAWRITIHQVPHQDFYNPIGALTYQLIALGMKFAGPTLVSISYANLFLLIILAPWAWFVASSRLPYSLCALFTAYIALLITAVRPLGYEPGITTYAMLYNRIGWALLCILFIQILFSSSREYRGSRSYVAEGVSAGTLLALLLYCKISYFAFAALGTVVGFILRELNGKLLIALVVTFALCCAAWWFVLGINPIHYFGDLKVAAEAQSLFLRRQYLLDSLRANRLTVSVLLAGVAVTCIALRDAFPRSWKRLATRFVVVELFLICATFAIASGNAPEGADLPLLFVCLLFALSTLTSLRRETSAVGTQSNKLAFWCVFLVGAPLLAGPMIVNDISSFSIALGRKKLLENHSIGYLAFDSSSLSDFIIPADSNWHTAYWLAHDVPSRINDGIYLLHQHSMDGKKILPLTFGNPFAYAMQFTPPKGAPLWWDLDFSVSIRNLPKPEKLFHDVDAVIYPILHASDQGCCKQTVEKMLEFYEPYITKHYVVEYRSSYWVLRVRTEANLD